MKPLIAQILTVSLSIWLKEMMKKAKKNLKVNSLLGFSQSERVLKCLEVWTVKINSPMLQWEKRREMHDIRREVIAAGTKASIYFFLAFPPPTSDNPPPPPWPIFKIAIGTAGSSC